MELYSLENEIHHFFNSDLSPSRQECDELVHLLLGGQPVLPCPIQGQFSYTVFRPQASIKAQFREDGSSQPITDVSLVQFRRKESQIDIYVALLAKAIHGDITAETYHRGEIGHDSRACLKVYEIQKLPGVTYIEMGNFSVQMNPEQASKQLRMIEDLARFFAESWLHPQLVTQNQREITKTKISDKLSLLESTLPHRFTPTVSLAQRELDELFHPRYSQVLTHGDLCPMNILVSPTTGRVTGIIDWAEAKVLPFGLALYGLESLLGYMGPGGWSYLEIRQRLEEKYWIQFWDCIAVVKLSPKDGVRHAIMVARQVGVLLRYGFQWENGTVERPVTEQEAGSLAYLDAFLLTNRTL